MYLAFFPLSHSLPPPLSIFLCLNPPLTLHRQYRPIPKDQLPPGVESGDCFTSVCINTALYLPWLVSQCLKAGVVFKRKNFAHISDAANAHHSGKRAGLVVNCTGLSAGKIGGVEDKNMIPVRGQTVLVRNDSGFMCNINPDQEELSYVMQRGAGKTYHICSRNSLA